MKKRAYKYIVIFSCLHTLFLSISSNAIAQNNSVSDYVPPPLFGGAPSARPAPTAPKKRHLPAEIIQLRKNDNEATVKTTSPQNLRQEKAIRAAKLKKSSKNIPIPQRKPKRQAVPQQKQAGQKPTSQGVVKGPKTMPAVKKKSVDAEKIDQNKVNNTQTDMLARVQTLDPVEPKKLAKDAEPETKKDILSTKEAKSLLKDRLVLIFDGASASLSDQKQEILKNKVIPVFADGDKRLNVTAFASPQSEGLNSDKRLALSRALAVRSFLIENGISSNQINIRSLGAQTTKQPYDRVELQLMQ
ncbi:MAG: hypothetical protein CMH31_00695 [Micavibrio sp.]|nr:hypothetical protein [Micavibrio sp.]